jgi:hypothetical protein
MLLNPGKKRKSKKARRVRSKKIVTTFKRRGHIVREKRWAAGRRTGGQWTNPMPSISSLKGTMTNQVLPLAAGVIGNMLLRPKLSQWTNFGGTVWKNAAVGVGSAVVLGLGTGLVAKKYTARVVMGALIQTAVTTVIEAKSAMTPAPAPAPLPALAPVATTKGLGWEDASSNTEDLAGYSPDLDEEPEL